MYTVFNLNFPRELSQNCSLKTEYAPHTYFIWWYQITFSQIVTIPGSLLTPFHIQQHHVTSVWSGIYSQIRCYVRWPWLYAHLIHMWSSVEDALLLLLLLLLEMNHFTQHTEIIINKPNYSLALMSAQPSAVPKLFSRVRVRLDLCLP